MLHAGVKFLVYGTYMYIYLVDVAEEYKYVYFVNWLQCTEECAISPTLLPLNKWLRWLGYWLIMALAVHVNLTRLVYWTCMSEVLYFYIFYNESWCLICFLYFLTNILVGFPGGLMICAKDDLFFLNFDIFMYTSEILWGISWSD